MTQCETKKTNQRHVPSLSSELKKEELEHLEIHTKRVKRMNEGSEIKCTNRTHRSAVIKSSNKEFCMDCLINEIIRLRAYVQGGVNLLWPYSNHEEIRAYRERAIKALAQTLKH